MIVSGVLRGRVRLLTASFHGSAGGRSGGRRRRAAWLDLAMAVVFAGASFLALGELFDRLAGAGVGAFDAGSVLALILTAALAGILVFDLHEAVSTLVLDDDLSLLRRAPIGLGTLLAIKLFDALPHTSLLLVVLAGPALAAFGLAYGLPAWAWLAMPLQLFALWAMPLGIGMGVALLLARAVPPSRVRDALGLLTALTLVAFWITNAFVLPELVSEADVSRGTVMASAQRFAPVVGALPSGWIARGLAATVSGSPPLAAAMALAGGTLAGLGAAALALGFLGLVARLSLESAMSALAGSPGARRRRRPAGAGFPHAVAGGRGPASRLRAFIQRDLRLFVRNWSVLADLVVSSAMWAAVPLLLPALGGLPWEREVFGTAVLATLAIGLGSEVGARAVPLEREAIAWCRLAPGGTGSWAAAKWLTAGLMALPLYLAAAAAVLVGLRPAPAEALRMVGVPVLVLVLALGIGVWFGARFGDPAWTNPRSMMRLSGRLLAMLAFLAQAAFWAGAYLLPLIRGGGAFPLVGFALATLATTGISMVLLRLAARRLPEIASSD